MSRDRDSSGPDGGRGEGFGSRWSRLKREVKTPPAETPPAETPAPTAESPAPPEADERSDAEILEELGLPDPDTLGAGDDFKAFMTRAVPARIRNRALRRLWTSNPVLANLDRLVDYDDDFTDAAVVPAILNTGYKVGRGWLEETEEAKEPEGAPPEESREEPTEEPRKEPPLQAPDAAATGEGGPAAEAPAEDAHAENARDPARAGPSEDIAPASARPEPAAPPKPGPRRMRFRFTKA